MSGFIILIIIFCILVDLTKKSFGFVVFILIIIFGYLILHSLNPHLLGGQDQGYYTAMSESSKKGEGVSSPRFFDENTSKIYKILIDKKLTTNDLPWSTRLFDEKIYAQFYPLYPQVAAVTNLILGTLGHLYINVFLYFFSAYIFYKIILNLTKGRQTAIYFLIVFVSNPQLLYVWRSPFSEALWVPIFLSNIFIFLHFLDNCYTLSRKRFFLFFTNFTILSFSLTLTRPNLAILFGLAFTQIIVAYLLYTRGDFNYNGVRLLTLIFSTPLGIFLGTQTYIRSSSPQFELFKSVVPFEISSIFGLIVICFVVLVLVFTTNVLRYPIRILNSLGFNNLIRIQSFLLAIIFLSAILLSMEFIHYPAFLVRESYTPDLDSNLDWSNKLFRSKSMALFIVSPSLTLLFYFFFKMGPTSTLIKYKIIYLFTILTFSAFFSLYFSPSTRYLYYYGRYFASELIPISILLSSYAFYRLAIEKRYLLKILAFLLTFLTIIYGSLYSYKQVNLVEAEQDSTSLYKFLSIFKNRSVILTGGLVSGSAQSSLQIPLIYIFNADTITVNSDNLSTALEIYVTASKNASGLLYIISDSKISDERALCPAATSCTILPSNFEMERRTAFNFTPYLPPSSSIITWNYSLSIYEITFERENVN